MLLARLLSRWFDAVRPPKIHEVREFYRQNQESFRSPELIAASHIVKHSKDGEDDGDTVLAEIRTSILAGEDFAAAAKRVSDCPDHNELPLADYA